jgi:hypothetical protein
VVRSVLSWEACEQVARDLDTRSLMKALSQRETAKVEDLMLTPSSVHRRRSTRCIGKGPGQTALGRFCWSDAT